MFDIKFLRENVDLIKKNNARRGSDVDVDEIINLDSKRRSIQQSIDEKRAKRNAGSKSKPSQEEIEKMRTIGGEISKLEEELLGMEKSIRDKFDWLPNLIADDVPDGLDDSDNKVIKTVGSTPSFSFTPVDHMTIGERLDIIDVAHAANVSGSRFYFLKNAGALLRLALHRWGWEKLANEGFDLMTTPHLAKQRTLYGTGYLPFFSDDVWTINDFELSLIGTSEQTLVGYHQDEILLEKDLPKLYTATSECFRTEAGSYGKDTKGIFRVHEFWKMEQIILCTPESVEIYHQKALEMEEWFATQLGLAYHVVLVCTGDCGAPGHKKYDLEAWFPSQNRYRELTSNTNLTDFQTSRLNIRYKTSTGEIKFPYTISATALTDRWIIAILEQYQQEDGSVMVPTVLRPYMGMDQIKPKNNN